MYIDTHAHLNFKDFAVDYSQAIERAFEAGVKGIINVGSNLETSKKAIEIADKYNKGVYAAIGLHPIHIKDENFDEKEFEKLAQNKKVVAIGETGLDYYYDRSSTNLQKEVFEKSLQLASVVSKPIILHSRDAGDDILSILMAQRPEPLAVMHCFQGDWQMAQVLLDMGLYISFTGLITFTKNYATFEVIEKAPLERILIETDCPFMTPAFVNSAYVATSAKGATTAGNPEPMRGKRNEPAYVIEVARKIAEIKKLPLEKVEEQTTKNAMELFGLEIS